MRLLFYSFYTGPTHFKPTSSTIITAFSRYPENKQINMKYFTKNIPVLLPVLFSLALKAQTNVSGGIYANTSWTLANSPYIITDTVVVFPGVTLTIDPGVTVKFADNQLLEIRQAKLIAAGTSVAPITFTSNSSSPTPGIYPGIYLNGGTLTPVFNFCNFWYANTAIISNNAYTIPIKNSNFISNHIGIEGSYIYVNADSCVFRNNYEGIEAGNGAISNCRMTQNHAGMVQFGNNSIIQNCIIDSNYVGLVGASGSVFNSTVSYNSTGIAAGGSATIDHCIINANNTGIEIGYDSIKNCVIDSNTVAGIDNDGSHYPGYSYIYNNKIRYNGNGINETGGSQDIITRNTIENNTIGILSKINPVVPSSVIDLTSIYCNKICTNSTADLKYTGTNNTSVGANYWCTSDSTATAAVIYDGYDNASFGLVNFMPLDTSSCALTAGILTYEASVFSFRIFPDPATDYLTVELPEAASTKTDIKIFNMLGDLEYAAVAGKQTTTIDVSAFAKGIYFIQLTTGNKTGTQKFIKQ